MQSSPPECCSCYEHYLDTADIQGQGHMVCMSPFVFTLSILLSGLMTAGVIVAIAFCQGATRKKVTTKSRYFREGLREAVGWLGAGDISRHDRRYINSPVSSTRSKVKAPGSKRSSAVAIKAAEIINRATVTLVEPTDKAPPRYVRASCGNEEAALKRWKATLRWRDENRIDSILGEPQPLFQDIRRCFPSHISGRSRSGHIVVYEKLGYVDIKTLKRDLGVTVPVFLRHWTFVSEYIYSVLQPRDFAQQVTVVDMKGFRLQSVAGDFQEYFKRTTELARRYYVERSHKTFVVNAPAWFGLAFRAVSPFFSPRTKKKIRILGSDLSPLLDEIEAEFLPVEYGGENTTPVSDSPEESDLCRLVSAINAGAMDGNGTMVAKSRPSRRKVSPEIRLKPQTPSQVMTSAAREASVSASHRPRARTDVSPVVHASQWTGGENENSGAASETQYADSGGKKALSRSGHGCEDGVPSKALPGAHKSGASPVRTVEKVDKYCHYSEEVTTSAPPADPCQDGTDDKSGADNPGRESPPKSYLLQEATRVPNEKKNPVKGVLDAADRPSTDVCTVDAPRCEVVASAYLGQCEVVDGPEGQTGEQMIANGNPVHDETRHNAVSSF